MSDTGRTLLVGLGSPHGDDRIGWRIADELQPCFAESRDVSVRKATVPLDVIDWLDGVDRLHICDAYPGDAPFGAVLRLEASVSDDYRTTRLAGIEQLRSDSSHSFGLPSVLDLAARLRRLPPVVVIHGISACRFAPGVDMIDELTASVPTIARTILEELADARDDARTVPAAAG